MATVNFSRPSKKEMGTVYIRLKIMIADDTIIDTKIKTKEKVEARYFKSGSVKILRAASDTDKDRLHKLIDRLYMMKKYVEVKEQGVLNKQLIDNTWIKNSLEEFYSGRLQNNKLNNIVCFLDYFEEQLLPLKTYRGRRVSVETIGHYKTQIKKIKDFLLQNNLLEISVKDFDTKRLNEYQNYLIQKGLSYNTIGRTLKYPKSIFKIAKQNNIEISPFLEASGWSERPPVTIITKSEIDQLKLFDFSDEPVLEYTKDWMVINFWLGQRVSDLHSIAQRKIITIVSGDTEFKYLEPFCQKKTKVTVQLALHDEVLAVLKKYKNKFRPLFAKDSLKNALLFNRHIKTILKKANINRLTEHRVKTDDGRYTSIKKPLYDVFTSHCLRRSFATYNYKEGMPIHAIMAMTGHKSEKVFRSYINEEEAMKTNSVHLHWQTK